MIYNYDVAVVGAGHNGLISAAYLAKSGKKVIVLDRNSLLGGCSSGFNPLDGFNISRYAYVVSLLQKSIVRDLNLNIDIIPRNPSSYTPSLTKKGMLFYNDYIDFGSAEEDKNAYYKYNEILSKLAAFVEEIISEIPPQIPSYRLGLINNIKNIFKCSKLVFKLNTLSYLEKVWLIQLLFGSANSILDKYFKSDFLKATLATDAIIGSFTSPYSQGSAYVLLHHVMGDIGGSRGVWGYIKGGMGQFIKSLEDCCKNLGVVIENQTNVIKVESSKKEHKIIAYKNQKELEFIVKKVLFCTDVNSICKITNREDLLEQHFFDYSSASGKINICLNKLPNLIDSGVKYKKYLDLFAGTIHLVESMKEIEEAYHDARMGRFSKNPILEITIPSVLDSSLSPPGSHVMSVFVQYLPYDLEGGWTPSAKEDFLEICITKMEKYMPNIRDCIIWKELITPEDIKYNIGISGGNIFHGSMNLTNIGPLRPFLNRSDYTFPIPGIYICGSAGPAGGGISGVNGRNCAQKVLEEWV